jgi:2-amino-4-hydroxy-6-hydroxymethyldihydropteridine diphosphokinase
MSLSPARVRAYVGLGANLGDAPATVLAAWQALAELPQTTAVARSALYRSAPIDATGPDFINAVAALDTALAPLALLDALQALELRFGRERPYRNAPRTLDLDLLLHGEAPWATERLQLPHPRAHQRAFVLRPLLELDPGLSLPGLGPAAHWLAGVADQPIERLSETA